MRPFLTGVVLWTAGLSLTAVAQSEVKIVPAYTGQPGDVLVLRGHATGAGDP
jgi:hypothetical protein